MKCQFPKNFYWGSAVSAHQVEGDNFNSDWWEWESIRPSSGQAGKIDNHDKSGKACDFWNQYKEDLKLAKKLNQNAFRFSIEWAKIIESRDQVNKRTSKQLNNKSSNHKINKSINQVSNETRNQEINKSKNQRNNKISEQENNMSLRGVERRSNLRAIDRSAYKSYALNIVLRHTNARDDSVNSSRLRSNNSQKFNRFQDDKFCLDIDNKVETTQQARKINYEAIRHYQDVVDYCHKLRLEPFVTLHHFTNPHWFSDIGGWEKKENIKYFLEYVNLITQKIKGVKYWITINEPCVYANGSFLKGVWPPGKKNIFTAINVVKNMIVAHNEAYKIIKKNCPDSSVGFAKNNAYFEGGTLANGVKKYWNHYFLDKTKFDYIGLNYYFHDRIVASITPPFFKTKNENKKVSDMNWEIYPEGIFEVLMDLKKYKKPIIITENGLADAEDKLRGQFIVNHLKCIRRAIQNGVDVKGYLYWSLLDNFEWAYGFKPRFGLIEVDYKTQKRTIRKSALTYAKICKSGTI